MAQYLKTEYGYVIDFVVGHSRGSVVAFYWIAHSPHAKDVGAFVNASGRYRMQVRPVILGLLMRRV